MRRVLVVAVISGGFEEFLYLGNHASGAIAQFGDLCICIPL